MVRASVLLVLAAAALLIVGCGGGGGEDSDAAVPSIYVTPALCKGARQAYRANPRPGGELVSMVCLDYLVSGHGLAAIGRGARKASENSATIAYVGEPDRKSVQFSLPILEAAGIGTATGRDGAVAMRRVLAATRESAGSGDLRGDVRDRLEGG